MKKLALLTLTLFSLVACNNSTKTDRNSVTKEELSVTEIAKQPALETGCYAYTKNGDQIKMQITEVSEKVAADLSIAYAEKDANRGKFVGTLNGDKLIGTYTFNSEGIKSDREIAFLVKDNQLIEGYGEMDESGTKFKDTSTINYTSKMPLKKLDCVN